MLPAPLVLVTTALAASALAQDDQPEDGSSAPYKICPMTEYSQPYCCTNLLVGLGIGCRVLVGPEEYKSLRDFQNDCFTTYVERQAACCSGRLISTNYLCTEPTVPVETTSSSVPSATGRFGWYGRPGHADGSA